MAKHIKWEVSSDIFNSYFKFTVIRNPWDKAVSQFCYTQQKRPDLLKSLNLSENSSFREYLHKISEKNHVQWEEQYKFIYDNYGKLLVDYICIFEQLKSDFQKVIFNLSLNRELFELPHTNQTERKNYSHYYDDKSRQIVAEKYQTDIEKFGYFFESEVKDKFKKNNQIKMSVSSNQNFMEQVTDGFISKANKFKKEGKLDEAIATYRQGVNINPSFVWYYHELGNALAKKRLLDEAIAQYFQATKINPKSAWFCYELGKVLQKKVS